MEGKTGRQGTGDQGTGAPSAAEARFGPGWRGWAVSILVAVALSVTATLLLGGYGGDCCRPPIAGKR